MADAEAVPAAERGRVVALDLGDRRIGVARSDLARRLSVPHEVVTRSGDVAADHRRLAGLVTELEATRVVVGLPLGLDGRPGPAAAKVAAELEQLRAALDVPVETWDERLSTAEVLQRRRETIATRDRARRAGRGGRAGARPGAASATRRPVVDDLAASVILQGWLDAHREEGEPT